MERSRWCADEAAGERIYERQGRQYTVVVTVEPVAEPYLRYTVEVTDEWGRVFRCIRLERQAPA